MTPTLIRSLLATLTLASVGLPSAFAQTTERVSVDSAGIEGNGGGIIPSISSDGRFVVFYSGSNNLVPGDTNGVGDIFLHDRMTGQTIRVSVDSAGVEANDGSNSPAISGDGRYIAFQSSATNLVSNDTNQTVDVFVYDRLTGITSLVSVDSGGVQANQACTRPALSVDGRYIAFESEATNLVPGSSNTYADIFVRDQVLGLTSRASVDAFGVEGNGRSGRVSISGDGQLVAFWSEASSLVQGDTNGTTDCFVHYLQTGQTSRVSVDSAGAQANAGSLDPSLSLDGRYVAFSSHAWNLVGGDTNQAQDIFVHDLQTGLTTRASVDSSRVQGDKDSEEARLSADGRFVAFGSNATNLIQGDSNGQFDIFVHDQLTGETIRVSVGAGGGEGNQESENASISANGRIIAFQSPASNLVSGDTNNATDVFVHDLGPAVLSLSKTGNCPGPMSLTVNNSTPNRNVALVYGPSGNFVKSTPPCVGLVMSISQPILGAYVLANAAGTAILSFYAPSAVCGLTVQAVDIQNCAATNAIVL